MRSAVRQVEHVVVEAVLLVPEPERVHRVGDVDEVLPELARHVLVGLVRAGELHRDAEHVQAVHRHPAGAVGLLDVPAGGQRRAPVEHADVVQPQEAALEHVAALGVLPVHPPGEVQHQLVEDPAEEGQVPSASALLLDLVDAQRGPGEHRRVHVAERPLVGWDLPVRVHVPLAEHAESAAPWRSRSRPARAGCSGRRGPRPRTRGTPTCPACSARRRCGGAPSRSSARPCASRAAAGGPRRPRASRGPRSGRTACSRASRPVPGA